MAALLTLLFAGCFPEREVAARTQILVSIETEPPSLREDMSQLRVRVFRLEGNDWVAGSAKVFSAEELTWPVELPLVPGASSDRNKQFEVIAEAMQGETVLAQTRAVSHFLRNDHRRLPLVLSRCPAAPDGVCAESACHGPGCTVCKSAVCTPVDELDPNMLPTPDERVTPERDGAGATAGDAGRGGARDASRADAAERDASTDGRSANGTGEDASEPGPDSVTTCTEEGRLRCPMAGTALRERCEAGAWVAAPACEAGKVCDGSSNPSGSCRELLAVCVGNAGRAVCDGEVMRKCDAQGNASAMDACDSAKHCQDGLAVGKCAVCLAGQHRCTGAELQVCAEDGQSFVKKRDCPSAALCNAMAGTCGQGCAAGSKVCMGDVLRQCKVDLTGYEDADTCDPGLCDQVGQQCDLCVPNAKSCSGNSVRTCNAQGQGHTMAACAPPRGVCTGNGVCVECSASSACPSTGDPCLTATCDVASGTCKTSVNARARCAGGVCDSSGNCVGCIDARDCTTAGARYCSGGACVQCTSNSHCNAANHEVCQGNRCVVGPYCGDGMITAGEQCDPKAQGWSVFTCSETCRPRNLYNSCGWHDDCDPGVNCGLSYCWYACNATSDCPAAPVGSGLKPHCAGACMLSGCRTKDDCPQGTLCMQTPQGISICVGCDDTNYFCPDGEACIRLSDSAGNPTTTGRCQPR